MGNLNLMKQRISRMLAITVYDDSKGMIEDFVGFNSPDYMFFRDLMLTPEMIAEAAWRLRKYQAQLTAANLWGDDLATAKKPEVKAEKDRRTFESQAKQVGPNVEFTFKGAINKTVATLKAIGARGSQVNGQWVWTANVNRVLDAQERLELLGFDLAQLTRVAETEIKAHAVANKILCVISRHENFIVVNAPYNASLVNFFRQVPGFKYNNLDHSRKIEIDLSTATKLRSLVEVARKEQMEIIGEKHIADVERDAKTAEAHKQALESLKMDFEVTFPGAELLKKTPYGYQGAGIAFLNAANGRAIIGDEMGLGKTLQALAWVVTNHKRALVICPNNQHDWAAEVEKFAVTPSFQILTPKPVEFTQAQFTLVNYESCGKHDFSKLQYDTVIIDESHLVKNAKTARFKNIAFLTKDVKHVILISGTSIINRPVEFFTQLNLVKPGITGTYGSYTFKYCAGHRHEYGWDASGASNLDELRALIAPIYLRRNKADVLPELPPKIRQEVRLEGVKIKEKLGGSDNPLAQISRMKIALAMAKIESTIKFVKGMVEQGEKVIVFSDYVEPVKQIAAAFGEQAICYLSELTPEERHVAKEAFQNDPTKMVFVATSRIASVSLTLTAASHVVFNDLPWTPGTLLQAEDRAHRIGQLFTLNVYRMVASGTLDMYITELLTSKAIILKQVLDKGLDGMEFDSDEKSILTDIVRHFAKEA
jgi:SWI/SNF-related matrix-associated actin-dependent regulator of chromatin subfamily A-like protein 1